MPLVNYLTAVFEVIWQNNIFHWMALILLCVAVWGEYTAVKKYQEYVKAKSRSTAEAIDYLNSKLESGTIGSIELRQWETPANTWTLLLDWFSEHLAGEIIAGGEAYKTQIKSGRFVLFQYPTILTRSAPRSQWRFVPSILISLGVLGTFYGIQTGLQNVSLGGLQDTKELLPSISTLLEGMKTAFSTSLMGLGSSSVFIMVLAWGDRARAAYQSNFLRAKLDRIAKLQTAEQLFSGANSSADVVGEIALATEAMQAGFAQIVDAQNNVNSQAIGQQIGLAMTPVFQDIRQELSALKQIKADQGEEILNNLLLGLRTQVIEPVAARLDSSAQLTHEASEAVRELKNELGGISASLAQSILTIQTFQQDTLVQLQEFANNLQQILKQFQTDTHDVLQEMATEIRSGVGESIEGMKAQRTAFQESAQEAANTFRGIQDNLQAALHIQAEQEKEMLQGVEVRMTNILNATHAAFQTQSDTIKSVGDEASGLMDKARENLTGSLQNVDEMLQNTRVTVQQELDKFRVTYQSSLQQFFTEQNNLLEGTLGKQQKGLAQVVLGLQKVFQEESQKRQLMSQQVDESMEKILTTAAEVSQFANSVGLNSSQRLAQLQELAKLTGQEVLRVESVYEKLANQFNAEGERLQTTYTNLVNQLNTALQAEQEQVRRVESAYQNMTNQFDRALELGNERLISYLERTTSSQHKFFEEADSSMAKVCSGLQESSDGLMQVAHYLVAAAD
ncbi:MAG: hypothetical protein HC849_25605, partial [Oscillatoriales cyanobacterium RU_3_3]|nr:hypothetical protein [Oscillatoriales cyanobacterium RU_3_3]